MIIAVHMDCFRCGLEQLIVALWRSHCVLSAATTAILREQEVLLWLLGCNHLHAARGHTIKKPIELDDLLVVLGRREHRLERFNVGGLSSVALEEHITVAVAVADADVVV